MSEFKKITTPPFRVSFPNVFKPRAFDENQEPKYSIMMCFPKDTDLSILKDEIKRVAREKWGDEKPKKFMHPIKDGEDMSREGFEEYWIVNASTLRKPGLVDKDLNLITEEDADEFYPGCWARATINAFAYDNRFNKGVSFGLQNIHKVKDDESFVTKSDPRKEFERVTDDEVETDSKNDAWD